MNQDMLLALGKPNMVRKKLKLKKNQRNKKHWFITIIYIWKIKNSSE